MASRHHRLPLRPTWVFTALIVSLTAAKNPELTRQNLDDLHNARRACGRQGVCLEVLNEASGVRVDNPLYLVYDRGQATGNKALSMLGIAKNKNMMQLKHMPRKVCARSKYSVLLRCA